MPTLNGKYPIIIVQGAQWGSEGKGMVAAALCEERNIQWAVRTGAVNAGHTVYWGYWGNTPHKMQQLPTGWVNRETKLVLGAGAYINPTILAAEITRINDVQPEGWPDVRSRLYIDFRAGIHLDERHAKASKDANRHHLIGATGKGCSEAIVDKISNRNRGAMLFKEWLGTQDDIPDHSHSTDSPLSGLQFVDTEQLLNEAHDNGEQILLEGTQGTFLDLHLGPYPYTTHKQCTAGQWAVECGLSPSLDYEVVLVARTYPIRVAGNSGPMPHEVDWPTVARRINKLRAKAGKTSLVTEWAIMDFEKARRDIAQTELREGRMTFPMTLTNDIDLQMHKWNDAERMEHRVALSELDKLALGSLSGPCLAELTRLFEMTTVTRKLRRIADWSWDMMGKSIRQNRPSYIVLAFANYWFPELWNEETYPTEHKGLDNVVRQIEETFNIDVGYITVGPKSKHMLERPIGLGAVGSGTAK